MLASGMSVNEGEWNVGDMVASGMLANDGERMMASGMLVT